MNRSPLRLQWHGTTGGIGTCYHCQGTSHSEGLDEKCQVAMVREPKPQAETKWTVVR
jgi:hypothetical protein